MRLTRYFPGRAQSARGAWPAGKLKPVAEASSVIFLKVLNDHSGRQNENLCYNLKVSQPIVNTLSIGKGLCFTLLALGFNAACTSWGKFWEIDSELSACRSRTVNDSLAMICVPANTSGFLRGSNVVGVQASPEHTVASIRLFALAKYEISYAQWLAVKTWATAGNGYVFALAGTQGNSGGGTSQQPVTTLNWRDAIIWCNTPGRHGSDKRLGFQRYGGQYFRMDLRLVYQQLREQLSLYRCRQSGWARGQ
ncbi:MAG: SUMF1/EgtB/PvdO family nonheme iron enzyme [Turneriella sp.]|nr:SUMF1/EgtB/PvdO family nonheme iron enzyme [Turneriella sp.]